MAKKKVKDLEGENKNLREHLERKESTIKEEKARMLGLEKDRDSLRLESERLIEELRRENKQLKEKLETEVSDKKRLGEREIEIAELKRSDERSRADILAKDAKILELVRETGRLEGRLEAEIKERSATAIFLSEERKGLTTSHDEIKVKDVKISELKTENEHLKTEIKDRDAKIAELKREREDSKVVQVREEKIKDVSLSPENQTVIIDLNSGKVLSPGTSGQTYTGNVTPPSPYLPTGYYPRYPSAISTPSSTSSPISSHPLVPILAPTSLPFGAFPISSPLQPRTPYMPTVAPLEGGEWKYTKRYGGAFGEKSMDQIEELFAYSLFGRGHTLLDGKVKLWSEDYMLTAYQYDDPQMVAFYRGAYAWEVEKEKKRELESIGKPKKIRKGYPARCMPGKDREIKSLDRVKGILRDFCDYQGIDTEEESDLMIFIRQ